MARTSAPHAAALDAHDGRAYIAPTAALANEHRSTSGACNDDAEVETRQQQRVHRLGRRSSSAETPTPATETAHEAVPPRTTRHREKRVKGSNRPAKERRSHVKSASSNDNKSATRYQPLLARIGEARELRSVADRQYAYAQSQHSPPASPTAADRQHLSSRHERTVLVNEKAGHPSSAHRSSPSHHATSPSRSRSARSPSPSQLQSSPRSRLVSPSLLSVMSGQTEHTSSSSGSNSTVTQGSGDAKSHHASKKGDSGTRKLVTNPETASAVIETSPAAQTGTIDVFKFLEEDAGEDAQEGEDDEEEDAEDDEDNHDEGAHNSWQSNEESASSTSSEDEDDEASDGEASSGTAATSFTNSPAMSRKGTRIGSWTSQDAHQDSSNVPRGGSPDSDGRPGSIYRAPSIEEEEQSTGRVARRDGFDNTRSGRSSHLHDPRHSYSAVGPDLHRSYNRPLVPYAHMQAPAPQDALQHYDGHRTDSEDKVMRRGYDLLASKLSANDTGDGRLAPLYRKFERLNHRVLLHLQDEISELEEQLQHLDDCIERHSHEGSKQAHAESRRADARYGNELHFQRTNLIGHVFNKINQYNQALSSYKNATRDFQAARSSDVATYRSFLLEHSPVAEAETRFLEHEQDLLRVSSSKSALGSSGPSENAFRNVLIGPPAALCLVLVALTSVSGFWGRCLLLVVTAGGAAFALSWPGFGLGLNQEDRRSCVALYGGILVCASVLLPSR